MLRQLHLRACPRCGLTQRVPDAPPGMRACCARCGATLRRHGAIARSNSRTAAIALAALVLYPIGVTMPMLVVQQLGQAHASSIIQGVITLLADGQLVVGTIVLFCSIILPLGKLIALVVMSAPALGHRLAREHRALTYRVIEFTGRWGMLDVLAVAVLVAALKLGNVMDVTPGPAALAFSTCVILSLLATASFDPRSVWEEDADDDRLRGGRGKALA